MTAVWLAPNPATVWGRAHTWTLGTLIVFGTAVASNYTNHAPLLPLLMAEFSIGPVEAGLISSALFVTLAVGQLMGGVLCDRYGTRRVGVGGLLLAAAATLSLAGAHVLSDLIALKALAGLGAGVAVCAGARFASLYFLTERAHLVVGLFGGAVGLGGGLAISGMPLLASETGWRLAFVGAAGVSAAAGLLWLVVPNVAGGRAANPLAAIRCSAPWLLGAVNLSTCALSFVVGTWVTIYLVEELLLQLVTAAAIGSTVLTLGLIMRPLGGELTRRGLVTTRLAMRASVGLTLAGLLAMAVPGRPLVMALVGVLLLAVGVNLPYSAFLTTAPRALPSAPSAALGLTAAIGSIGSVPLMTLVGWLYALTGSFLAPFAALAALVLLGAWATVVVPGAEDFAEEVA